MGKIIGIGNQKGGTGKTTSAINIASYIALAGKKTLLVDMDPQGNSGSGSGIDVQGKNTIYDVILGNVHVKESCYPTLFPNLFIIPSDISLVGGEIELVGMVNREWRLREALNLIRDDFDYIFIDAPPSLGLLTLNVLGACDSLIVPIQCEYYALEGVSKLLHTIDLVKERINPKLEIEGILLTMADLRTRLTLQVIEEVRRHFGPKTFNTIIPRNIKLAEAPSFGKPAYYYDRKSSGSRAYLNLAEEILKMKINDSEEMPDMTNISSMANIVAIENSATPAPDETAAQ